MLRNCFLQFPLRKRSESNKILKSKHKMMDLCPEINIRFLVYAAQGHLV